MSYPSRRQYRQGGNSTGSDTRRATIFHPRLFESVTAACIFEPRARLIDRLARKHAADSCARDDQQESAYTQAGHWRATKSPHRQQRDT